MSRSPDFDQTIDQLRAIGSVKWSQHPDAIGAFVAEMDFGTAARGGEAMRDLVERGLLGYLPDRLDARLSDGVLRVRPRALRLGRSPPERVRPLADVVSGADRVASSTSRRPAPR